MENLLNLFKEAERAETLKEFFNLPLKVEGSEILTVKGHNLIFSTQLVRTEFSVPQKRWHLVKLIEEIEKLEPFKSKGLKPLKEFLQKGKPLHIDLKPFGVERILIVPPLGWEFEEFDPNRDFGLDWSMLLRGILYSFLGQVGNFYPDRRAKVERPFGVTDLDKNLFDEVGKDFLKEGNVFVSREVNLLEMLV